MALGTSHRLFLPRVLGANFVLEEGIVTFRPGSWDQPLNPMIGKPHPSGEHATECYVFEVFASVSGTRILTQVIILYVFTSILLLTLVACDTRLLVFSGRNYRPNCIVKQELRRNGPRSRSPSKLSSRPPFVAFSSRRPTNQRWRWQAAS